MNNLRVGIIASVPGNIMNLYRGIERASRLLNISFTIELIANTIEKDYDILFLPGVGHFRAGMERLKENGFVEFISDHVEKGKILVGVCLGMQLLFEKSEEAPEIQGLSLLKGKVKKLKAPRLPHMGWNSVDFLDNFFSDLSKNFFYFVHTYAVDCENDYVLGITEYYDELFPAAIKKENIIGFQFHPEKSHIAGLKLLGRLFEWSLYQL